MFEFHPHVAMIARAVALDSFHIRAMPPANPVMFGQFYRHLHVLERAPTRTGDSEAAATHQVHHQAASI